ncbi:MAG: hypothetical protein ABI181_14170 [Mycobacteriaceae bacterium]
MRDELEAGLAGSDLSDGFHRHRDELTRLNRDRLVVHDHPALPAEDDVDVVVPVIDNIGVTSTPPLTGNTHRGAATSLLNRSL